MARYEYACEECEQSTEITRGMTETEVIPPCPACGYEMKRVYNDFGIQFNGKGFYKTDNR
jgi:putative FmdB family regulatory protein